MKDKRPADAADAAATGTLGAQGRRAAAQVDPSSLAPHTPASAAPNQPVSDLNKGIAGSIKLSIEQSCGDSGGIGKSKKSRGKRPKPSPVAEARTVTAGTPDIAKADAVKSGGLKRDLVDKISKEPRPVETLTVVGAVAADDAKALIVANQADRCVKFEDLTSGDTIPRRALNSTRVLKRQAATTASERIKQQMHPMKSVKAPDVKKRKQAAGTAVTHGVVRDYVQEAVAAQEQLGDGAEGMFGDPPGGLGGSSGAECERSL